MLVFGCDVYIVWTNLALSALVRAGGRVQTSLITLPQLSDGHYRLCLVSPHSHVSSNLFLCSVALSGLTGWPGTEMRDDARQLSVESKHLLYIPIFYGNIPSSACNRT